MLAIGSIDKPLEILDVLLRPCIRAYETADYLYEPRILNSSGLVFVLQF